MLLLVFACQRARFLMGDRWVNLSAGGKLLLQSGAVFHGTFDAVNEGQRLRPVSAPVSLSPHLRFVHSRLGVVCPDSCLDEGVLRPTSNKDFVNTWLKTTKYSFSFSLNKGF